MNGPVVVGVDDISTSHGLDLLDAGAREAQLRNVPLRLVHAYFWTPSPAVATTASASTDQAMHEGTVALLNEAATKIRAGHTGLQIETVPAAGRAPQVLAEASQDASLLLVGGRGRGGFAGQLLGSVSLRVLSQARCPVMVVRGDARAATGRVMLGVDVEIPSSGPNMLEFAFTEAALRHADVYAVHGYERQEYLYLTGPRYTHEQWRHIDTDRIQKLEAVLTPWADKQPGVRLSHDVFPGSPAKILVDSTRLADLLVIGSQAHAEGYGGMRVGALAHTILHHAHCPVVIVPEH